MGPDAGRQHETEGQRPMGWPLGALAEDQAAAGAGEDEVKLGARSLALQGEQIPAL